MINRSKLLSISFGERVTVVFVLVFILMMISMTAAVTPRRTTKLKNSPIYFISSPVMMSRGAYNYRPQIRMPVRTTLPQTTNTLVSNPYSYSYSSFYKLPIQFVSNAKPIDVIKGITKTTTKKVVQSGHKIPAKMSNLIYLPITYLSNAKPIKVMINSLGKT